MFQKPKTHGHPIHLQRLNYGYTTIQAKSISLPLYVWQFFNSVPDVFDSTQKPLSPVLELLETPNTAHIRSHTGL